MLSQRSVSALVTASSCAESEGYLESEHSKLSGRKQVLMVVVLS